MFNSPADRNPVGLIPFGYQTGMRMQYNVTPRHAVAFVDWAINYGLQRPFRIEFPHGGSGLWFGEKLALVTTSAPDEFSSVVGNWPIPPYPLSYGAQRSVLFLSIRAAGFSFNPVPVEFCVPPCAYELATRFIWWHIEKGNAVAGYTSNGVLWIKSFPGATVS